MRRINLERHRNREMIIIGYQGIGKSTLAKKADNVIDLESGNFFVNGKRADDWYIPYCQIALHLSAQGNTVFVSSHKVVRDYLASLPETELIAVCYPIMELKQKWIIKLHDRFIYSGLEKDYKAWQNAVYNYEESIREITDTPWSFIQIPIESMDYDLDKLIRRYEP